MVILPGVHNICVCTVYIYYVYINTHTFMYIFKKKKINFCVYLDFCFGLLYWWKGRFLTEAEAGLNFLSVGI